MKEGLKLEQQLKDTLAIGKYAQAFQAAPKNIKAAIKCAKWTVLLVPEKNAAAKLKYYTDAKPLPVPILLDSNNADANYINAVVYGKLTEVESSNEKNSGSCKEYKNLCRQGFNHQPQPWQIVVCYR